MTENIFPGQGEPSSNADPRIALTIAGTDSGAGAGIGADLRTFAAIGVFGTLVVTTVTAQNTRSVREFLAMPASLVEAQLDALLEDMPAQAAKTGMLGSSDVVKLLATRGASGLLPPLVVDPVLVSSSGRPIFGSDDVASAYRDLLSCAVVVTPNLPEAALLTGRPVTDLEEMEVAARQLQSLGPSLVIVKGGRRRDTEAVDVAFDGHSVSLLRAPWVDTQNVHGTGCTFSAAIAANMALGREPLEAAVVAKDFVTRAILGGSKWHLGAGHGPLDQTGAGLEISKMAREGSERS